MNLITYFRNLRKQRKIQREEMETISIERESWHKKLAETPREEMFKILRKKGGIKSLKELQEANQLTSRIQQIWDLTKDDMLELSMDLQKMRLLYDTSHLYFIKYKTYESWDRDLQYFLIALAKLNDLNTFSEINKLGCLYYLNPLDEAVDTSNDGKIKAQIEDLYDKICEFYSPGVIHS